jgi:hypothetical protein
MCKQCNTNTSPTLDSMIKERRRLTNELASIKTRLLELRIDVGLLCDEAEIVSSFKVEIMNELSRAYDKMDTANSNFIKVINDAVL